MNALIAVIVGGWWCVTLTFSAVCASILWKAAVEDRDWGPAIGAFLLTLTAAAVFTLGAVLVKGGLG